MNAKSLSHPVWVRGLKRASQRVDVQAVSVAPRVGAWIETKETPLPMMVFNVAPRVGAWIETMCRLINCQLAKSHPVWVRGLKQSPQYITISRRMSHPVWVRGLKRQWMFCIEHIDNVAPRVGAWIETSTYLGSIDSPIVAPRVGAWIETSST